jgi:hypothetical protein
MSYSLLILPQLETMRPELLRKIRELVEQGANILGPPPSRSPSLQNFPEADNQVASLASELWGRADGKTVTSAGYGKGLVMCGLDARSALNLIRVTEDFQVPEKVPVLYIHRRMGDTDVYFITNQGDSKIELKPSFRVAGKQPELWDAVNGSTRKLVQFSESEGRTTVPLTLEPLQSCFIVFGKPGSKGKVNGSPVNFPEAQTLVTVTNPWQVSFDVKMRGPAAPVIFNTLPDWSLQENDSIRYYSGAAVYRTRFDFPDIPKAGRLVLDLGTVRVLASVKLNGRFIGSLWTTPWQIDISGAVRQGSNELEIEVVNLWVNRLIGDSKLPLSERKTWAPNNPYQPGDKPEPSGLLGPVTVKRIDD